MVNEFTVRPRNISNTIKSHCSMQPVWCFVITMPLSTVLIPWQERWLTSLPRQIEKKTLLPIRFLSPLITQVPSYSVIGVIAWVSFGEPEQLLINAEKMGEIQQYISQLKIDPDFAKRKVYQILEAYREGETLKAEQYIAKLPESSTDETLDKLKQIFGGDNAHWLHLMDLWDYID